MSCYTTPVIGWGIGQGELEKAIDPTIFAQLDANNFDDLEYIGMLNLMYTDDNLEGGTGPNWLLPAGFPWEDFAFHKKEEYIQDAYQFLQKKGWLRTGFTEEDFHALEWGYVVGTITG